MAFTYIKCEAGVIFTRTPELWPEGDRLPQAKGKALIKAEKLARLATMPHLVYVRGAVVCIDGGSVYDMTVQALVALRGAVSDKRKERGLNPEEWMRLRIKLRDAGYKGLCGQV